MTAVPSSDRKSGFSVGTIVAKRYRVERKLGEGAQGVVYEACRDDGLGTKKVALKVIHRHLLGDPQIFKRFHREANILKRLEGEHLVQFIDFIEDDGLLVIALEFVEARSLDEIMRARKEPLDLKTAVEIGLQVCAALGVAHAAGVVHRDLKPANVLVEREGDGDAIRVRVVDFGLAKVVHGEHMSTGLTEQDMIFGTPEYMAPEQARGDDADGRADLYAAGVMLYEMTVGKVPFVARTPLATMTAHLTQAPPSPRTSAPGRNISPALEAVIHRALAKTPADRYPTARAFAEALSAARDQTVVITPRGLDDRDNISTSDTDLHVSTTGIGVAKTLPEMPSLAPETMIVRTQKSPALPGPVAPSYGLPDLTPPPSAMRRDRWIWLVVALIAAVVGIAIGVVIGSR